MDAETVIKLCKWAKLDDPHLFLGFISLRFPEEQSESYILEWIERFKT